MLSLFDANTAVHGRVNTVSGVVETGQVTYPSTAIDWTTVGTVHPMVQRGHVYLTMPDLVTAAKAVGWAARDGKGGMLFSDAWLP